MDSPSLGPRQAGGIPSADMAWVEETISPLYSTSPEPIMVWPMRERVLMSPSPMEPRWSTRGWMPRLRNS